MCVHISYSTQWKVKIHIFVAANHKTLIYANLALLRLWLCARLNIFVSLTRTAKANDRATLKAQLRDAAYVYIKTFLFVCVCACLFLCVCMWDCEAELKAKFSVWISILLICKWNFCRIKATTQQQKINTNTKRKRSSSRREEKLYRKPKRPRAGNKLKQNVEPNGSSSNKW